MEFLNIDELAAALEEKLNDVENDGAALFTYGLNSIYPNTGYRFKCHPETGEYIASERVENTVIRYINGEISLGETSTEGIGEDTYNAVINVKAEFLIPLLGNEKKNKQLISSIRALLTSQLKYTVNMNATYGDVRYTHIINYDIATTGVRAQREVAGDSISLTIYITHTFVALGISSNLIQMQVYNTFTREWETVAYSKLGIARKTVCESNVFSDDATKATKNTPVNSLLTISVALLTRMRFLDYLVDKYTYNGILTEFNVKLIRPNIGNRIGAAQGTDPLDASYWMIFDTSGINAELDAISSTSITLVETKRGL